MTRSMQTGLAVAVSTLGLALLASCAEPRDTSAPPPESRAKAVLDAQYAAEGHQPPMQSAEAERIYNAYLESIGKKLEKNESGNEE
ncbi:MAG: hypothetical protein U0942_06605 [Parvibaculum sp.]|uniref:hypothetical protein n=1 Tax=Parvibaculum sp. TaxID=2024848 RepID=UPI002ABA93A5|nr:hypothetical protein [Parvibaculum sp.]MDZ4380995.1 hypothetical protein [Parvibaculum sp.]